jgi:pimeloyl-ACP methyl ester carboxylesterase
MNIFQSSRRALLTIVVALFATMLGGPLTSLADSPETPIPIVFVHGNGDTAALWQVIMWRFESNGYPRSRLFAIDLRNPSARTEDSVPEPGKSSIGNVRQQLADFVAQVRLFTGARKVALVGNSRGANTIRNYVKNGGGASEVSIVVLGGGVNHGVFNNPAILPDSEFNGASRFMKQLNAGENEVVAGVKFYTLRSDRYDKYAQPDGRFLGLPGVSTGISYNAPALKGAIKNVVLPGVDHREAAYAPEAFSLTYQFITGRKPVSVAVKRENSSVLAGRITGLTAGAFNNIGVAGAKLAIYRVNGANGVRIGGAAYTKTTGANGAWGPFSADPSAYYEFVVTVSGQPITHIYRSPFPRGSRVLHLRPAETVSNSDDGSVVILSRPRGYFDVDDTLRFDGARPPVSTDPVPNESTATIRVPFVQKSHTARYANEIIPLRNWPEGHVAIAEFTY